jgi:hypothetical protein
MRCNVRGAVAFADVATLVLFAAVLPQLVAGIEALVAESILVPDIKYHPIRQKTIKLQ